MRIETVLLGLGIASIVVGSTFAGQEAKAQESLPLRLFAQAKEDDFTGSSACAECHDEKVAAFAQSAHNPYSQREDLDTFPPGLRELPRSGQTL
jgi:cytochrome c553